MRKKETRKRIYRKKNLIDIETPKLMNSLSGELRKGHQVKITFEANEYVDLTSLQLLASAIKSLKAEQRTCCCRKFRWIFTEVMALEGNRIINKALVNPGGFKIINQFNNSEADLKDYQYY